MDFYKINEKETHHKLYNKIEIYPDFKACWSKDLMVRGKGFYGIWDEEKQMWSTNEFDVQRLVDAELEEYAKIRKESYIGIVEVKKLLYFSSNMWKNYRNFLREMPDSSNQLDESITFSNTKVVKSDYVSKRVPYPLEEGSHAAYDELMSTLYLEEERRKLEWAIGAIISGDAKNIQKFIVLYGEAGSGKSTFLNIVEKLFQGYCTAFEAKALTGTNNAFSIEPFRENPLVAIQHDGDLSRIEDNTKLNSIVSHEYMTMNEKYKSAYSIRLNAFLFMGTNKPVKITEAKSGLIRRLIDVKPSGNKIPNQRYHILMNMIDFELGAIAYHCLKTYQSLGKNYYANYKPFDMMFQTDVFFNFIEENYYILKEQKDINLSQAYSMYKTYCDEALVEFKLPRHKFREELKNYYETFYDITRVEGKQVRSYYRGFLSSKFNQMEEVDESSKDVPYSPTLDETISQIDNILKDCPAQYTTDKETPENKWSSITTKLSDLDTHRLHYVKPPLQHIVIDFDLKDETGQKSVQLNLEAASKWPVTYAEFSKSGSGIHLHYIYEGDVSKLSRVYSEGIEIKTFTGLQSLRRKFTKCNNSPIATLNSGLPLKGEKPMLNFDAVRSEKGLRDLIIKNLNKEIHPGTKPSIDFIWKILDDAHKSGLKYDVTDLRPKVLAFANNSTNQADYCIKLVNKMSWASDEPSEAKNEYKNDELIFFDVEVFPNLFVVCWKLESKETVKMINPEPKDIEELFKFKLVGFNNRRYDNHILYARYIGYNNLELYNLSQKIIGESKNCLFGEAYNLSYTDVYDFSAQKQSLKRFQIELGIHHQELGLKWDEPVPEELWGKVADYCVNDVVSLQAVFESRKQDFIARLILADLSGLTPNDTTQMHTAKIIFGNDKRPQDKFVYTDLSKEFPGYLYENGKSTYRGEETGEGGYVYAEPGMYTNVAVLDVASMHPTSLVQMNMFGPYTKNFDELLDARIAIKHKDYEKARAMLGGILNKYLTSDGDSGALAYALKIVINIVYGLTSAKFDNKFKDPRNKDNIVAKRGALFMIDLKHAVQEKGFQVTHIKTDSIKIPNATPEIIAFVMEFGKKYGYTFEHEDTYSRFCLLNDSVYIARDRPTNQPRFNKEGAYVGPWQAVGTQFLQSYMFKTLFSKQPISFDDMYEVKTVTSALYLDMNENLEEDQHNYHFVGKAGAFCPIKPGCGGGLLCREKDGKYYAANGSTGYRWLEAEIVKSFGKEKDIDLNYYKEFIDKAIEDISKYGDFEWFVTEEQEEIVEEFVNTNETPIWCNPEDDSKCCDDCPNFISEEDAALCTLSK